ncbi:hypothetical protein [Mycobacterium sp. E2733]|uniref:hypothetical protein n=1 Tax=Mycobacterium sp. E2733 TaxID=1834138 RepID=UPI000800AFE9|nr:hypothetical protein [Mycobacterium sp. E2733]OBH91276.1 hypothetical protein A5678_11275 [Mycobacterium sp. E2733]
MLKKAIFAGWAVTAFAVTLAFAAPAHAAMSRIVSEVYWSGPACIPVRSPHYPDGSYTQTSMVCGGHSTATYYAFPGEFIGADPQPEDATVTLGCSLYVDGNSAYQDYARDGDHHDVNCLRVLPAPYSYDGPAQNRM